jgi:hypothetical protein
MKTWRYSAAVIAGLVLTLDGHHPLAAQVGTADSVAATLKSDLRNLVVSQETFFAGHNTYASKIGNDPASDVAAFRPSPGNALVLSNVSAQGWTGVLTNGTLTSGPINCGVFVGPLSNTPNAAVTTEGTPACWGTGLPPGGPPVSAASTPETILASMRADLRNLVTSQEAHYSDFNTYASAAGPTPGRGVAFFNPTAGNSVVISNANAQGWAGVITNPALTTGLTTCGVYVGAPSVSPHAAVTQEGMPACWEK